MLPVLIQSLFLATSGLLSVGSITLVILLLISDRGWRNGLGYALGYTSAYSLIGVAAVIARLSRPRKTPLAAAATSSPSCCSFSGRC